MPFSSYDSKDWDVKITVNVMWPSVIAAGTNPQREVQMVDEIEFDDDVPADFRPTIQEFNAYTVWKQPVYSGVIRVPENSPAIPRLRNLLHNREYVDIEYSELSDLGEIKGTWQAKREIFVGALIIRERGSIVPENVPVREFSFKSRYRKYPTSTGGVTGLIGDGWTPGEDPTNFEV